MYKIIPVPFFSKQIKKLAKKYPGIIKDFSKLNKDLKQGIFKGDRLQGYPGEVYKVRVGSIDQQKGKRGGFRVAYLVVRIDEIVYLMDVYAKNNQENLTKDQEQEINDFIKILKERR